MRTPEKLHAHNPTEAVNCMEVHSGTFLLTSQTVHVSPYEEMSSMYQIFRKRSYAHVENP